MESPFLIIEISFWLNFGLFLYFCLSLSTYLSCNTINQSINQFLTGSQSGNSHSIKVGGRGGQVSVIWVYVQTAERRYDSESVSSKQLKMGGWMDPVSLPILSLFYTARFKSDSPIIPLSLSFILHILSKKKRKRKTKQKKKWREKRRGHSDRALNFIFPLSEEWEMMGEGRKRERGGRERDKRGRWGLCEGVKEKNLLNNGWIGEVDEERGRRGGRTQPPAVLLFLLFHSQHSD